MYPHVEDLCWNLLSDLVAYVVLCIFARRMQLSLPIAASLMLIGWCVALVPGIVTALRTDLEQFGDQYRKWSNTDSSDAFFTFMNYMNVGYGKLHAFVGMVTALLLHATVKRIATGQQSLRPQALLPPASRI